MSLAVGAFNYTPAFNYRQISLQEYECYDGPYCQITNLLSEKLETKFHYIFPTDGGIGGTLVKNGSWNGQVGLLQRKEVEFAAALVYSFDRFQVTDFPLPLIYDKFGFAVRTARPINSTYALFHPFKLSTWICILISFLVCFIMLAILRHRKRVEKSGEALMKDLVSSAEIMAGKRDFKTINGNPEAQLFCAFSNLSMVVLVFCYTAVLLAFLMTPIKEHQIKTFAELAQAAKFGKVKIAIPGQSFLNILFSSATVGAMKDLSDNIKNRHTEKENHTSLLQMMDDGYAIIDFVLNLKRNFEDYNKKQVFISEDTTIMENVYTGLILQKNSKYMGKINWVLQRLIETGVFQKIRDDFKFCSLLEIQQHEGNNKKHIKSSSLTPMSVSDFKGLFLITLIGFILAFVSLSFERYIVKKKPIRKQKKKKNLIYAKKFSKA